VKFSLNIRKRMSYKVFAASALSFIQFISLSIISSLGLANWVGLLDSPIH
jgi:hypothetical protein